MRLPRAVVAASIAARQNLEFVLPSNYCSPTCPNCKSDVGAFNKTTSCTENSSFLTNCGACQQCIITYFIEEGTAQDTGPLEGTMQEVLNLCADSPVSADVVALQSQASRLSLVGDIITRTTSTTSSTPSITNSPAQTTKAMVAGNQTASISSSSFITPAPTIPLGSSTTTASGQPNTTSSPPLNQSWIVGPVIGSILGIATVVIVIYFTKRKHQREAETHEMGSKAPSIEDDDLGDSTQVKPQLHSDSVPVGELEAVEFHELPAVEPVGSELNTPRDGKMSPAEDWPLPISPVRALFVMAEILDERAEHDNSPKHKTYYNP